MTRVIHIKDAPPGWERNPAFVYIGRPRAGQDWRFGNPFVVGQHGPRGECCSKFKEWLRTGDSQGCPGATPQRRSWILNNLWSLFDKTLVCFCHPSPCHGDELRRLAHQLDERGVD